MDHGEVFQGLKARYCFAAILIAWYWQPGSQFFAESLYRSEWYWSDLAFHYYGHGVLALFLILAAFVMHLHARDILGRNLARSDLQPILLVLILTYCASLATVTLAYVPLSYLVPDFVSWWISWWFQPVIYIAGDGSFPLGANILSFVSLVILAPLLEELLFRGYLLHRWSKKWGLWTGVLLSSVVFGAVHPDTLAAAITGAGFAMLYLKTQTLWAPIAAHALYNFIAWAWDLFGTVNEGIKYYTYTVDQLLGDWWQGFIAFMIVVLLIDRLLRQSKPLGPFKLPYPEYRRLYCLTVPVTGVTIHADTQKPPAGGF